MIRVFVSDDLGPRRRAVEQLVEACPGVTRVARRSARQAHEIDVVVTAQGRSGTPGVAVVKAAWLVPGRGGERWILRAIKAAVRGQRSAPAPVVKPAPASRGRSDAARVREVLELLHTLGGEAEGSLAPVVEALPQLLGTEQAFMSEVADGLPPRFRIVGAHFDPGELEAVVNPALANGPAIVELLGWNPLGPMAWPGDRAVARDLHDPNVVQPPIVSIYPRVGLPYRHQLATLVCDGDEFLAYVGVWRPRRFGAREKTLLQAIVPALRDRLRLDRRLGKAVFDAAALGVALEAMPGEAFIARLSGGRVRVEVANAAGRARLDVAAADVEVDLRAALAGRSPRFSGFSVQAGPAADLWLVAPRVTRLDAERRLQAAVVRHGLTPREGQVLGVLARGAANKEIAQALGCATNTVEHHVKALLRKAGVDSRAALVAQFWTFEPT